MVLMEVEPGKWQILLPIMVISIAEIFTLVVSNSKFYMSYAIDESCNH